MKKVALNSTALIFLTKINKLKLFEIFDMLYTTEKIKLEVLLGKNIPVKEKEELELFFKNKIKVTNPKNELVFSLETGESSVLSLCVEQNIKFFISDDKKARNASEILNIKPVGTLGILLLNLKRKK